MTIYISSLNETLEVADEYLPSQNIGLIDEADLSLLEEEGEDEGWD